MSSKRLVLIELNEVNFNTVERYVESGMRLPNFEKLLAIGKRTTKSEEKYELLEPWIQWVSAHTGLSYSQHKVFRLGDIKNTEHEQVFEKVEKRNFTVGCLSPMNTKNNLRNPSFFVPDPWTDTSTDGSWYAEFLKSALVQAVNDNSQSKVTVKTLVKLLCAYLYLTNIGRLPTTFRYFSKLRKMKFGRAIFLDVLLMDMFSTLLKRTKPNFGTVFLNAGAHIQHHYYHNSSQVVTENYVNPDWYLSNDIDPLAQVLMIYDALLEDFVNSDDIDLIIATGLSQEPFEVPVYYWRLKSHYEFFEKIGINIASIEPRMTRDFLVTFDNNHKRDEARSVLESLTLRDQKIFGEIEVRECELFVTLTFPYQIGLDEKIMLGDEVKCRNFEESVSFVALKNGHHCETGFILSNRPEIMNRIDNGSHVAALHDVVLDYFSRKEVGK